MAAMQTLVLKFLGPPRFERNAVSVPFVRAKGVALLLYLAVVREAQPRERVLDVLWPESLPQAARKNLRNTLWAIGEALGEEVLEQEGGRLRLAPNVVVDVHGLEDGLLLLETGSVSALEAATALYQGPLADGLDVREAPDFEIWLHTERERLAALYVRLSERVITLHRAAGAWERVVAHAERALLADPTRETIHLALIEAYVRLHQRSQALQQYATLTDTLKRELHVAPLPETTARYEALLSDVSLPPAMPPPRPPGQAAAPTPFIGREAELAALDQERSRALEGEARVVLMSGDLGMGKTQLWRTWLDTRAAEGIVVTTHALETAEPLPFGPVLTLFRQPGPAHAIVHPPSPLAPIWLAELTRLLPELADAWPNVPPPLALAPAEERARLLQALTEAMRLLAAPLLVLVVDDLHWADPSTLDWLMTLVDQLQDAPLLLIGTYRPQDMGERLRTTVAAWQRQGRLSHLPLAHLSETEARQLLTALGVASLREQEAEWVRQSGGNPYYLLELQRAGGDACAADLAALLRARLQATVPAPAIQVLQAAAVLGDGATFPLLQTTAGRSEEDTLAALDALLSASVLTAEERTYRFIHPLVGTVVRMDLSPARRAFLHRRAAEALERAHMPHTAPVAARLMEHYAEAEDVGRAASYAEQAARHALQVGAFIEAVAYARRALAWEPTAARHLLLGETVMLTGSTSEAHAQLQAAVEAGEQAGDVLSTVRACLALATLAVGTGQTDVARRWLGHATRGQVELLDPAVAIQALQIAAFVERQRQAYDAAEALLDRAEQLAQQHQLTMLDMQVVFERGNVLANRGNVQAALVMYEKALQLAQTGSNPVFTVMAHNNLAYHTLLVGDRTRAHQHIAVAVELSERYALSFLWQYVWSTLGEIALATGELEQADSAFERAFEAARTHGNRSQMANVRVNQARAAHARKQWDQAYTLVEEAAVLFDGAVDPVVRDKIAGVRSDLGAQGISS
jgi:DNA-binding SARP family transcriptional activator/predicted negative regulator of RcsB-dependent stress response